MKMKIAITSLVVAVTLAVGGFFAVTFYFSYVKTTFCRHLETISDDSVLVSNLWQQLSMIIEEQAGTKDSDFARGVVFAREYEGGLGIDWEVLGIPLSTATIEIRGEHLYNGEFDPRLIDKVGVGYGYRYHLVFTIKDEPGASGPAELSPSQWSYDVSVECRNQ